MSGACQEAALESLNCLPASSRIFLCESVKSSQNQIPSEFGCLVTADLRYRQRFKRQIVSSAGFPNPHLLGVCRLNRCSRAEALVWAFARAFLVLLRD